MEAEAGDVDVNEEGWTALHLASLEGSHKVVRVLLGNPKMPKRFPTRQSTRLVNTQQDIQTQSRKRLRPTVPSSTEKSQELQILVGQVSGLSNRTALHVAAEEGHHKVVKLLLVCCSESTLNALTFGGRTALSLAASQGHDKIVKLLLDHNLELSEHEEADTVRRAVRRGHDKVVKLLINSNPKLLSDHLLFQAVARKHWGVTLVLLDECERINGLKYVCEMLTKRTGSGNLTILHQAVKSRSPLRILIARLLKFTCQQTSVDEWGNTVLHDILSSAHFWPEVVAGVLAMDPSAVRTANKKGETPFDIVLGLKRGGKEKAEVLQWQLTLDEIKEFPSLFRERAPGHLEKLVRHPLLSLLHRDVVQIVCDFLVPDWQQKSGTPFD